MKSILSLTFMSICLFASSNVAMEDNSCGQNLLKAVESGCIDQVKECMDNSIIENISNRVFQSAISIAVGKHCGEIVLFLLQQQTENHLLDEKSVKSLLVMLEISANKFNESCRIQIIEIIFSMPNFLALTDKDAIKVFQGAIDFQDAVILNNFLKIPHFRCLIDKDLTSYAFFGAVRGFNDKNDVIEVLLNCDNILLNLNKETIIRAFKEITVNSKVLCLTALLNSPQLISLIGTETESYELFNLLYGYAESGYGAQENREKLMTLLWPKTSYSTASTIPPGIFVGACGLLMYMFYRQ